MTGELGQLALCLALALALMQSVAGFVGASRGNLRVMAMGRGASLGSFVFVGLAFFTLMFAYITSDFSVLAVAQNSHTAKPLIYKISGVWGNHEGSMVMWILILGAYSAAIAMIQPTGAEYGTRLASRALGIQGLIAVAFLLFVLLTSDPFERYFPPPFEGSGLNPLLQDPGLAFHPPLLYVGYVGLSAAFSFAAAALLDSRNDAMWVRAARPFALVAWTALTLGIAAGSWWAYYTLGWGGFWFWDPVENASLMPWMIATALIHSMMATERTGAFKSWTLLLAITAFSFSLIGTFLVRSGVLNSVHAFANDPERGLFILLILVVAITLPLILFAWRAPKLSPGAPFDVASRETGIMINNLLLTASAAIVMTGTLYPLVLDALNGTKISVGPPYYTATVVPLLALLAVVMPFGPLILWRRGNLWSAIYSLRFAGAAGLIALLAALAIARPVTVLGVIAAGLGVLAHRRLGDRSGAPRGFVPPVGPRRCRRLECCTRACGAWRRGARLRRLGRLAQRSDRGPDAGREHGHFRLRIAPRLHGTGAGPQLHGRPRQPYGVLGRPRDHPDSPREAQLSGRADGDHAVRHPHHDRR